MPTLYVIAGPNGVGKTTFADEYLPDEAKQLEFVSTWKLIENNWPEPRLLAVGAKRRLVVRDRKRFAEIQQEVQFEL